MGIKDKLPATWFSPVGLAILLSVLLFLWLLIGDHKSAAEQAPPAPEQQAKALPQVEFRWSEAREQDNKVIAQGELEPWQALVVKAQVTGQVEDIPADQGTQVSAGQTLVTLSDEGRSEKLAQAKANLTLQQSELDSGKTLQKSNFTSQTDISRLRSNLAQSKAELVAAQLAVKHAEPAAPFDGVVDRHHIEIGEWVSPGSDLISIVDIAQLKVIAWIPQQEVARLHTGQSVSVRLLDGRELAGEVSFISYAADPETRSYYIEITAQNPDLWRVAGASATVQIQLQPVMAHSLSPAYLSLDEAGKLGIFAVDEQDTVTFYPVKVLRVDNEAAIVSGLPERLRMITLGAGFVDAGQRVKAVEATL